MARVRKRNIHLSKSCSFSCCRRPSQPSSTDEHDRIGQKGYSRVVYCNEPDCEEQIRLKYRGNYVSTTKYTAANFIPKSLFEQFRRVANIYFLVVACVSFSPLAPYSAPSVLVPLIVVIGATMAKEGIEDYRRRQQDVEANNRTVEVYDGNSSFNETKWKNLRVGDIVKVHKDEYFPADLLLLSSEYEDGVCYVETMNLDGETNTKSKHPLEVTSFIRDVETVKGFRAVIKCEDPNEHLYSFVGTLYYECQQYALSPQQILLRGTKLKNTDYINGVVIFTGHDTKVMQNAMDPPSKRTRIERRMDRIIYVLFSALILVSFVGSLLFGIETKKDGGDYGRWYLRPDITTVFFDPRRPSVAAFLHFLTGLMLYGYLIPISLYVSIEICKVLQSIFINQDQAMYDEETKRSAHARTSNLNEELGQVCTILSDKTGTLTCNSMEFVKCSIAGTAYGRGMTEVEIALARKRGETLDEQRDIDTVESREPVKGFTDQITMEAQSQPSENSKILQTLALGPLSSSLSSLSSSSPTLPSNQDFHFFNNFSDFKLPIDQIAKTSDSLLESIGASAKIWGANKAINFPSNLDSIADDEAYDWLVDINDELLERFDVSIDEFHKIRKKEEETGRFIGSDPDNNGFQLVYGKKKKKINGGLVSDSVGVSVSGKEGGFSGSSGVKVKKEALATGTTGKAKVPFHIPMIRKPQEEYNILVNNSNQPFEHVWLQRSEDGQRFVHPLENLSVMDFVEKDVADIQPIKPPSIESTSFKLVEEVKDLKDLASKLSGVEEFAVDLEHNQYRSFQGLTCLMQISTRTEDFIVDTLKLRIHVGPYLREVFKDPNKKKVMHGADRDIVWLQRDFGIYVCNLFDTGQASRVLKLERNSLEHLLQHYCGVTANKEYQNADWRLRPLPDEMLRYAREDTHYLLYIYDLMRIKLLSMPQEGEHLDAPLVEVYKRSSDVCTQLFEKELLTENSYLHIHGLQVAGFNAEQLAVVAGLCEWRDIIARAEDESTGYVLPNKMLLEIAKQMPVAAHKLRQLLKSRHPYVERNLGAVVSIIRHAMQNAVAFEAAAQQLKMGHMLNASEQHIAAKEGAEVLIPVTPTDLKTANDRTRIIDDAVVGPDGISAQSASLQHKHESIRIGSSITELDRDKKQEGFSFEPHVNGSSLYARENLVISGKSGDANAHTVIPPSAKMATGATIQVLKKPSRGFGALLGNASTKKKFDMEKKEKEDSKLAQIRSSVNLSFHSFSGTAEQSKPPVNEPTKFPEAPQPKEPPAVVATESSTLEDIIMLEDNSKKDEQVDGSGSPEVNDTPGKESCMAPSSETEKEDETMSLSDLSTSFQQCFESMNQNRKAVTVKKSNEASGVLQIKPFDYEAARKEIKFGEDAETESGSHAKSGGKKKSSVMGRLQIEDGSKQFPQARRRQAFPASGNRSATFR